MTLSGAHDGINRPVLKAALCLTLIVPIVALCAGGLDAKDDDKTVIKYTHGTENKKIIADLLDGIDLKTGKLTDKKSGSVKVGIFAEEDAEGTIVNVKYQKKMIYPDKDYKLKSINFILRGYNYKDLVDIFNKKLKTSKATKDTMLKRQKLLRLLSWCEAHYLPDFKKKVEKEIGRVDPDIIDDENAADFFKRTDVQDKLVELMKSLPDIENVSLASSEHITIASDFLPPKTIEAMLKTGERVFRDFTETMYDEGVNDLKPIPNGEILRMFMFTHTTTLEAALKQASKFAPGLSNRKAGDDLNFTLSLGGTVMRSFRAKDKTILKVSFRALEVRDRDDPDDLSKIKTSPPAADYTNIVVSYLAGAMMANWLGNPPAFQGQIVMPWLSEGYSHYLCIKNLGVRGVSTTDIDMEYANREKGRIYSWVGDIEETFHRIAQDPTVDSFAKLTQYTKFRNLGARAENVAKCVSLIDFLMENNKIGFLNFLKDLQKHYRKLDKTGNQQMFVNGLDAVISRNLGSESASDTGMASRLKRKSVAINTLDELEEEWRSWAAKWVKGKKR